ncbi:MAG: hypothetical protein FJ087_19215, partial [Deltaproteobacteria bacterium]|nr:hypothetical protein [Deltaproteobacteria bacterium]
MPRTALRPLPAVALAVLCAACGGQADEGLDQAGFGLVFAPEAAAGCVSSGTGTGKLPADVSWLVGRLLDGAGAEVAAGTVSQADLDAGDGQVLLRGVP